MPIMAHVGLTTGKTSLDIYYQANTNGRYEIFSHMSHIASVFSLLGNVFKLKVRLPQSLKRYKAELISEIRCFSNFSVKKLN